MPKVNYRFVGGPFARRSRRRTGPFDSKTARGSAVAAARQHDPLGLPPAPTRNLNIVDESDVQRVNSACTEENDSTVARLPEPQAFETLTPPPPEWQHNADVTDSALMLHQSYKDIRPGDLSDLSNWGSMTSFLGAEPLPMTLFGGSFQSSLYGSGMLPQTGDNLSNYGFVQEDFMTLAVTNEGKEATEDPSIEGVGPLSIGSPHHESPSNISLTVTQLLERYDQEFCVTPLTHDFDANPFRADCAHNQDSQLLRHCVLALSYKHIHRDTGFCVQEAKVHKDIAAKTLRNMNTAQEIVLDAILILMTLDCATSAHGPWTWYLEHANKTIQAMESTQAQRTPKMQARTEMLVWWDVTLSMTSRQGSVLPESTITSLLSREKAGQETFYGVSGCPEALFRCMIRLGSYAAELELLSQMTCAQFDIGPVLSVEREIREWKDPEYEGISDQYVSEVAAEDSGTEEQAHHKEDLYHCAEAWRYGLLIYICRVFKWQRGQSAPLALGFLARRTLNHVSSCRRSSTLQKQLLLPVFLAGCETTDQHLRKVVRDYCRRWNERTRYDMFLTANALLEEIWANVDPQAWWGSVIDEKSRVNVGIGDGRHYLFG